MDINNYDCLECTELRRELHPYNLMEKDEGIDENNWVVRNQDLLKEESGYQDVTDYYTSPYEII